MKNTLPLRLNYEFAKVYRRGSYFSGKYVVLHCIRNGKKANRLGVTTSKKVKGSVSRNRMRRLLRESYRLREDSVKPGYDIVMLGRENPDGLKQCQIDREVVYLLKKAGLWNNEDGVSD